MNKLKIEIIFSVLTYGSLIIFWVRNEKVNIQHLFCCLPLTDSRVVTKISSCRVFVVICCKGSRLVREFFLVAAKWEYTIVSTGSEKNDRLASVTLFAQSHLHADKAHAGQ